MESGHKRLIKSGESPDLTSLTLSGNDAARWVSEDKHGGWNNVSSYKHSAAAEEHWALELCLCIFLWSASESRPWSDGVRLFGWTKHSQSWRWSLKLRGHAAHPQTIRPHRRTRSVPEPSASPCWCARLSSSPADGNSAVQTLSHWEAADEIMSHSWVKWPTFICIPSPISVPL